MSVKISGIVTGSSYDKRSEETLITVKCVNANSVYLLIHSGYIPAKIGDSLFSFAKRVEGENFTLRSTSDPFIKNTDDMKDILCHIMSSSNNKIDYGKIKRLLESCNNYSENKNFIDVLSNWAELSFFYKARLRWDNLIDSEGFLVKKIVGWWYENYLIRRLLLLSLTREEIDEMRFSPSALYDQISKNPHSIFTISSDKSKFLTTMFGVNITEEQVLCGLIQKYLWKMLKSYHSFVKVSEIEKKFGENINYDMLVSDYRIVIDDQYMYLDFVRNAEKCVSDFIRKLKKLDGKNLVPETLISCDNLCSDQRDAVIGAINSRVSIITGPAGTGKTTCIKSIINNLEKIGRKYIACSFTGKAVSRIKEVTKCSNAKTIHRILYEEDIYDIESKFGHVIIDEASMVNLELMKEFLHNFGERIEYITFIGDVNQLPPIGWGDTLGQLIQSNSIKIYKLSTNYRIRNVPNDGIILNSNKIVRGNYILKEYSNFRYIQGDMSELHKIARSHRDDIDSLIIITPRNYELKDLNTYIQNMINKGKNNKKYTDSYGNEWFEGDRVMLLENRSEINVYNGEQGKITKIDNDRLYVDFGQSGVHHFLLTNRGYNFKDERYLTNITLSYAITVDKSQGSEWDIVLFYLPYVSSTTNFINKNRIYTAITRAKKMCYIISGVESHVFESVCNKSQSNRYERLFEMIDMKLDDKEIEIEEKHIQ